MAESKRISMILGTLVSLVYMLFYGYDYLLQTSFSILPSDFLLKYGITTESFGFLSAAFFYGYTFFQIPLGYCLDRIGLKYTAIICAACCVLGTTLFYFATDFTMLFIARFFIGAGSACACVMSVYAVSTWMLPKHFSLGVGLVQSVGCLGSIFGQALCSLLLLHYGWNTIMHSIIVFALVLLIIYLFLPTHPSQRSALSVDKERVLISQLPRILMNRQLITIAVLGFISWAPVSVLAASWMVRLLHHNMHWSQHRSASLMASFWVGLLMASLLIGKLSDQWRSRQKIVAVAFLMQCLCGVFLAIAVHITPTLLVTLLFFLGAAASVQTLSFVLTSESVEKKAYGTAAAMVNMVAAASGGVINPIFGIIVAHTQNYSIALWLFPVLSLVGIALSLWVLRDTYAQNIEYQCEVSV